MKNLAICVNVFFGNLYLGFPNEKRIEIYSCNLALNDSERFHFRDLYKHNLDYFEIDFQYFDKPIIFAMDNDRNTFFDEIKDIKDFWEFYNFYKSEIISNFDSPNEMSENEIYHSFRERYTFFRIAFDSNENEILLNKLHIYSAITF